FHPGGHGLDVFEDIVDARHRRRDVARFEAFDEPHRLPVGHEAGDSDPDDQERLEHADRGHDAEQQVSGSQFASHVDPQNGDVCPGPAYRGGGDVPSPSASFSSFQPSVATPAAFCTVARKLMSSRAKSSSAGSICRRMARPCSVKKRYPAAPPMTAPTRVAVTARELIIGPPTTKRYRFTSCMPRNELRGPLEAAETGRGGRRLSRR